jgi:hypothetical protein
MYYTTTEDSPKQPTPVHKAVRVTKTDHTTNY